MMSGVSLVNIHGFDLTRQDLEAVLADAAARSAQELLELAGVRPAQKYMLWSGKRCFDAVAIVKLALLRRHPGASIDAIRWDAKTVRDPLETLGFPVADRRGAPSAEATGLSAALQAVLDLQRSYEPKKTSSMDARAGLVTKTIPDLLESLVKGVPEQTHPLSVEGSNGKGIPAKVPWVRVFDEESSPSATQGTYVALLFAADGSRVGFSIGTGTQVARNGGMRQLPEREIKAKVDSARAELGCPPQFLHESNKQNRIDDSRQWCGQAAASFFTSVDLADDRKGASYELGTVCGFSFESGAIPDDQSLTEYVLALCSHYQKILASRESGQQDWGQDGERSMSDLEVSDSSAGLQPLAERLYFSSHDTLENVVELFEDRPQAIFYGPPGTGKTFVARELANHLAGSEDKVQLVQFHPSFAYEDFVEGWRPTESGQFAVEDGVLKKFAKEAAENPDETCVLIIDEINRANLSKVLGELFFLLEYRTDSVTLQYSGDAFSLPENLYVIGTMNTADRSIAMIDSALRRRFHFHGFFPDRDPIEGMLHRFLAANHPDLAWVADVVDAANEKLNDRHLAIGPSHFMRPKLTSELVDQIWRYTILPYIEDYFFDSPDEVENFTIEALQSGA